MATVCLLLALVGGVVVGDLLVENPGAGDVSLLGHPITGASEGVLLAVAAAFGVVVGLLVVASAGTTRTRRARRKQRRTAAGELRRRTAELEAENARLRGELARDQRVRHLGERGPADVGSTPWTGSTPGRSTTVPSEPAERHPEPLYEEAKRAARLRRDPDPSPRRTDDRARYRQTDEHVRRS
jgi:hypothetical protein